MLVRKIFPFGSGVSPRDTINIILLAEGFTAGQELTFYNHCLDLLQRLLNCSPLQYTHVKPYWLNVFIHFKESNQSGPDLNTLTSAQRTAYESVLTPSSELLNLNHQLIANEIDSLKAKDHSSTVKLADLMVKGKGIGENGNSLIAVLVPSSGAGGEFELTNPNSSQYPYIATTLDGFWHQVIFRGLGKLLKLGDEFDLEGPNNLSPTEEKGESIHHNYPNLIYSKSGISGVPTASFKWFRLLGASERLQALSVHTNAGASIDRTLLDPMYMNDQVELWEGAGTFRKNVYRSSPDCLMRRRTGDKSLPLRKQELSLCRICQDYLFTII
ncbi:hypothetical protein ACFRAE_14895 [Sphingobacterium sp. HJSM2_6]|uniref:hypothetical protein n=1 Tax=Sphingobacterium sp. HJSM2_6 TaxID=3366264 RepID=UPI003BDD28F8